MIEFHVKQYMPSPQKKSIKQLNSSNTTTKKQFLSPLFYTNTTTSSRIPELNKTKSGIHLPMANKDRIPTRSIRISRFRRSRSRSRHLNLPDPTQSHTNAQKDHTFTAKHRPFTNRKEQKGRTLAHSRRWAGCRTRRIWWRRRLRRRHWRTKKTKPVGRKGWWWGSWRPSPSPAPALAAAPPHRRRRRRRPCSGKKTKRGKMGNRRIRTRGGKKGNMKNREGYYGSRDEGQKRE